MAAVTTLFTRDERPTPPATSGKLVALYAFLGVAWLAIAIGNLRKGHDGRAWMHVIIAALCLFAAAMHSVQLRKQRSKS